MPTGGGRGRGKGKQKEQGSSFESECSFSEKEHMSMQLPRCSVARGGRRLHDSSGLGGLRRCIHYVMPRVERN